MADKAKLLFVDDDKSFLQFNKKYFLEEGYEVKAVTTGRNALKILKQFDADCIILDIRMPEMDGFTTCTELRKLTTAPIIFLTSCSDEDDMIKGLTTGADDYMVKPYSFRELSARIQVQLRRSKIAAVTKPNNTRIEYPPLSIDLVSHTAYYNDEEIPLSNREYELLYLLVSKPNVILTFEEIGETIWGGYTSSDRRTITVTASRLRKKFEAYAGLSEIIQSEWSKGYRFVPK